MLIYIQVYVLNRGGTMDNEDLRLLQQKATLLRSEGKYKETIEACNYLLECGIEANDYKSILTAYINITASYYCIGDIEEALNNIELYDKICDKHGDEIDKLNLYNTLFVLYEFNKDIYKAKQTLDKSIDLGKRLEKYNIVSNGYSNYSHLFLCELNYTEALKMAELGLEMARLHEPKSLILEIRVKLNIASAYIGLKDFDTSEKIINEILNESIIDSFIREKAQCYILKGQWYETQKQYIKSFEVLTHAKNLVESYNDLYILREILETICRLCELMNDIQQGYIAQREYISIINLISKKELANTALKLDIKHNLSSIQKQANTDYLTGLFNRSYLETTTNDWLRKAVNIKENIVCIVFDIDNFKGINDEYGHLIGDEVIKEISKSCSAIIREEDLIGRYGGDEFVIILRRSSLDYGKKIAERVRDELSMLKISSGKNTIPVKVSVGVADSSNGSILSFTELFHLADMRLYKAKENGKDQIYAFG